MRQFFLKMLLCCLFVAALGAIAFFVVDFGNDDVNSPLLRDLQGTWVSDAEATVAALKAEGRLTAEQIERLAPIFGKLTVTYKGNTVSSSMPVLVILAVSDVSGESTATANTAVSTAADTWQSRSRITVLEEQGMVGKTTGRVKFLREDKGADSGWSHLLPERMIYRVEVDADGYWLTLESMGDDASSDGDDGAPSIRERFVRIKEGN